MKLPEYIEEPFDSWCQSFSFFEEVSVRFSETDMFGHMNNVTPFIYFEETRISYFKHLRTMDHLADEHSRTIPVVASQQCDYFQQVMLHENLKIGVKTAAVGNASLTLHYLAKNKAGTPCFTGKAVMVQIAKDTGTPENWTNEQKAKLLGG
ncbi:thioesterase family protein [Bacillus swezeyi]|uniref:Acyl-CoA thioesterase n=1 Tax=Bacillus swezeyi TaxID=1925020 RepID=A0A5M8RP89_9BACI|nr:thioesterase family protein [Bacillus swezeyi]KAA6448694.1 acyl-CoA thioesterase [Bacillus swezeyi]KAA6481801.1 acyl-CoA thioesterase [Bacillus swezeyi]TYS35008.1 acyl-CoA thioesterase [Bacillus swezeyi]